MLLHLTAYLLCFFLCLFTYYTSLSVSLPIVLSLYLLCFFLYLSTPCAYFSISLPIMLLFLSLFIWLLFLPLPLSPLSLSLSLPSYLPLFELFVYVCLCTYLLSVSYLSCPFYFEHVVAACMKLVPIFSRSLKRDFTQLTFFVFPYLFSFSKIQSMWIPCTSQSIKPG